MKRVSVKSSWLNIFITIATIGFGSQVLAERNPVLPAPDQSRSATKSATVIGWPSGKTPVAAAGYSVISFATLQSPRSLYALPNGDVLVSQADKHPGDNGAKSPNKITLLKIDHSRLVEQRDLVTNLNLPFGMVVSRGELFVAEAEQVLVFRFDGEHVNGNARVIATLPYPQPQHHWTRHLLMSPDGNKLYVSVGSASNVGEDGDPLNPRNAAILEMNRDGSGERIFASGIRNAVSMAWEPVTGKLWAAVNERDELGDNLPPDYITAVKDGGFYGWPFAYWGPHEDPRLAGRRPDLVAKTITPDFAVGAHTAALGITFTHGSPLVGEFGEGAMVSLHGSWNRSHFAGYRVLYVPFKNGQAIDGEKEFLTGFIANESANTVYGRPVSTVIQADGSILVADDAGSRIWKVSKSVTPSKR